VPAPLLNSVTPTATLYPLQRALAALRAVVQLHQSGVALGSPSPFPVVTWCLFIVNDIAFCHLYGVIQMASTALNSIMAWCIGSSLAHAHHAFKPFYHLCKEIRFFIYLFEFFTMQPSFLHFACLVWQCTALHVSPLFR
jgi:hypothetical protein